VTTLADILRQYGSEYLRRFGRKIPGVHLKVIRDITRCRTQALGGQIYYCDHCEHYHYSYHSCGNRHCNQCQTDRSQKWLEEKKSLCLPVSHFLVTFTLPGSLRTLAKSHQKLFYNLLFTCAAQALQKLTADFKYLGGTCAMMGILHTWSRTLSYHPHIHFIIPGVAYFKEGDTLLFANPNFLVPVKVLSKIFKAKFRDALKKQNVGLFQKISSQVWSHDWVVHSENVGTGETAFTYLANYVFRVAISNNRILSMEQRTVTFKYQASRTKKWNRMTLDALEFIRRFLQHVLPKGFVKVRYYGFWAATNQKIFDHIRELLPVKEHQKKESVMNKKPSPSRCPVCHNKMRLVALVKPGAHWPHAPPHKSNVSNNQLCGATL
jgi:hypothetical protein